MSVGLTTSLTLHWRMCHVLVNCYGTKTVDLRCQGEELRVGFAIVNVKRPILSVSQLMDRGIETSTQAGEQILRRFDGATIELTFLWGLFVLAMPR